MAHRNSRGTAIGGHHKPRKGAETVWLTPPAILHALGPFDLDPSACPPPRPWPTASTMYFSPDEIDGLQTKWFGRVFCNPPYDETLPLWLERCAIHQNAIALLFARTEIAAWHDSIWAFADSVLFLAGRLNFYLPDGSKSAKNAGGPSALVAFDRANTNALIESGIPGALCTSWARMDKVGRINPEVQLALS